MKSKGTAQSFASYVGRRLCGLPAYGKPDYVSLCSLSASSLQDPAFRED